MLKKVNRLKKRYQFSYVYRSGTKYSGKCLSLYTASSNTKNIKVGLCVTKKIGHAVKRNKVRRRLREIVKKYLPNLNQKFNIVVVAKDNILDFEFSTIESDFVNLLKKADLFDGEKDF